MTIFRTRSQSGAAVIEFVIVAPVLLLLMFGLFDIGNAIQQKIWLEQAVRAGGMIALSGSATKTEIENAVQAASWSNVTTTVNQNAVCADGGTVQSDGTCLVGPVYQYVTISSTKKFTSFVVPITSLGASYVEQVQ